MLFSKHGTSLAGAWSSTGCSFLVMLSFTFSQPTKTHRLREKPLLHEVFFSRVLGTTCVPRRRFARPTGTTTLFLGKAPKITC